MLLPVAACTSSPGQVVDPSPVTGPLSVLLVNDDGWDADGIASASAALVAAGHRVVIVAPATNQSGRSQAAGHGDLTVRRPVAGREMYAVEGTPVDAVHLGLAGVLRDDQPDVVVSGINHGANVGDNVNYSGTVGAATAAAELGIPAIAISADVDSAGVADFDSAARVLVEVVEAAAHAGFAGLGREGLLNVNVPAPQDGQAGPPTVVAAELADASPRRVRYVDSGSGRWRAEVSYDGQIGERTSDARQLLDGHVTVTMLSVAPGQRSDRQALRALVEALAR